MEKIFQLQKNGTTVRTEILAGLTTFMTMAYIIALNPNLLTNFDTGSALWNGVFMATCIASALAMFCMAFLANKPFALAPGMGLNSFFAVVATNIAALTGMSYVASFQAALVIILLEGIVFLILSLLNIREKIVDAIPLGVRLGIAPCHRPDADEHRPGLQRGCLLRDRRSLLCDAGLLRRPDPQRGPDHHGQRLRHHGADRGDHVCGTVRDRDPGQKGSSRRRCCWACWWPPSSTGSATLWCWA